MRNNNSVLYHYTDFQALDGILMNSELRLNNVLNMNDASEMRLFMRGLCDAVEDRFLRAGREEKAFQVRELFRRELEREFLYSGYPHAFRFSGMTPPSGSVTASREGASASGSGGT